MRRRGELSTRDVARRIEVHPRTVRRWAVAAVHGEASRLSTRSVRRDVVGRYWVDELEVARLEKSDARSRTMGAYGTHGID